MHQRILKHLTINDKFCQQVLLIILWNGTRRHVNILSALVQVMTRGRQAPDPILTKFYVAMGLLPDT